MNNLNNQNKRSRLIESAALLFYHSGLAGTSLADIAKHADIPIGNVYYYFKTKEELALTVIHQRREQYNSAYSLLNGNIDDPRYRLIEAVRTFEKRRDEYAKFGCPIGKMIQDADVEKDPVAQVAAQVFAEFIDWTAQQFAQFGHESEARAYAVSLLARIQGAILIAKAMRNPDILSAEIQRLIDWLELLPNKKLHLGKMSIKA